jgi:hypothetical protein
MPNLPFNKFGDHIQAYYNFVDHAAGLCINQIDLE